MLTEEQKTNIAFLKSKNFTIFDEPHLLKIEPANFCTRKCDFCFLNKRGAGFMSRSTLENILEGCTSKLRKIEYCLSGEPTMNKELPEFISLTKKKYPNVKNLVLSNTDLMRTKYGFDYLIDLFDRGMNYIQTDLYDQESKDWFIESCIKYKSVLKSKEIQIFDYYKVPFNLYSYNKNIKTIFLVDEVAGLNHDSKRTRDFHTWGGNMPLKKIEKYSGKNRSVFPLHKTCSDPLKAMVIWNNGDVGLCCREGSKSIIFGNVNKERAVDIWQSKKLHLTRQLMKLGHRHLIPSCFFCLYNSFRDGIHPLWQDKKDIPTMKQAIVMLNEMTILDEGLKQNFIDFEKEFPNRIPNYIRSKIQ